MRAARPFRLLSVLLVLALVAAACGGDDGSDSSADGDGAGDTADGGDGGDGGDSAASGDDAADEPEPDPTDGDDASSDDGGGSVTGTPGDYCSFATEQQALSDSFNPLDGADAVRDYFSRLPELIDQAILVVPEDLRADFATLRDATTEAVALLEENDWNFIAAGEPLAALFEAPDVVAASERIEAYDLEVCGIAADGGAAAGDDGGDDDADGTAGGATELDNPFGDLGMSAELLEQMLSTEFGRAAFAEGFAESGEVTVEEALCVLDGIDLEILLGMAGGTADPAAMVPLFEAFDACGVDASAFIG